MARKSKALDNAPNRIREWRQLRNLTLKELAKLVGVTIGHMQKWEIADRNISYERFKCIAKALEVKVSDLLRHEDWCDPLTEPERAVVAAMRNNSALAEYIKALVKVDVPH